MQSSVPWMGWTTEDIHVTFQNSDAGQTGTSMEGVSDVHLERSALLQDVLSCCMSKPAQLDLSLSRRDWLLWKAQTASFRPDMLGDTELVRLLKVRAFLPRAVWLSYDIILR
jgi:hypothetical protein